MRGVNGRWSQVGKWRPNLSHKRGNHILPKEKLSFPLFVNKRVCPEALGEAGQVVGPNPISKNGLQAPLKSLGDFGKPLYPNTQEGSE